MSIALEAKLADGTITPALRQLLRVDRLEFSSPVKWLLGVTG
jgi:hypothetical protein